ncbi:glycosyltransferase [Clostridium perfringens]|uniref:glycosyltransferase n=1 Tax=Clostridium perfringens TaxID=1502 RepID=UPI0021479C89|nr:glycosyltransferase [Clostridium perfringens]MDM0973047.1 glycosyltransferase [Clostridium perfringens]MDU3774055.1 glycosyltransferase [Clostridium perfringens]UUR84412.1 glycosyltransferase [Clostridium perfringens]
MKIGILVTNIGNFGAKGLYNSQEIGMAKSLNNDGHSVEIYKYLDNKVQTSVEESKIREGINIKYIPVKSIGTHGISNLSEIETDIDYLIYFSDIQWMLSKVNKWCLKNNIELIPYVGVIESNSLNIKTKFIANIIAFRNILIYKRNKNLIVKTPYVKKRLEKKGVISRVVPVGLDLDLLKTDYYMYNRSELRKKYNISDEERVILFIGRLDEEKNPEQAVEILNTLIKRNLKYKLVMVGDGLLKYKVLEHVKKLKIEKNFVYFNSIQNKDIWEIYRISDYFINLNKNEIFGMAILEAMFYECKVIALEAPGPNFIIENDKSGYLVNSNEEIIDKILNSKNVQSIAHKRIVRNFIWNDIGKIIFRKL